MLLSLSLSLLLVYRKLVLFSRRILNALKYLEVDMWASREGLQCGKLQIDLAGKISCLRG
jgi:hypothetical protein